MRTPMFLAASAALATFALAPGAFAQNRASAAPSESTTAAKAPTDKTGSNGTVSSSDRKFMEKAARGDLAEVQLGQLAKEHGMSDEVKEFGNRMVTDHSKANEELKSVAASKGVTLPTEPEKSVQKKADKLAKLQGPDFDRGYMKEMVKDHKHDVSEFKKEAKKAKDPDVRKFAQSTLPILQEHLAMAQKTNDIVQRSKRTGDRETGSTKK